MGAPERSSGWPHNGEMASSPQGVCWESTSCKGNTVERVAIEERFSIRLARMADSCTAGILKVEEVGLERICCGGGAWQAARWISERRVNGKNIVLD